MYAFEVWAWNWSYKGGGADRDRHWNLEDDMAFTCCCRIRARCGTWLRCSMLLYRYIGVIHRLLLDNATLGVMTISTAPFKHQGNETVEDCSMVHALSY